MPPFLLIFSVLIGYSIACFGAGILILSILPGQSNQTNNKPSTGTELTTAFILGQGLLANFWLLVALGEWFSPRLVAGCVLVCAISGLILARHKLLNFARQIILISRELRQDSWEWQILAGLTLFLVMAWVTSLGRSMMGDATAFYMALPKVMAASQRLVPLTGGYEDFSSIGLQGEMHYAALMSLRSPDAAQLFSWPTTIAGAIMFLALGKQIGLGRRGQWLALATVFTSSAIIMLSGDGKVDLFAMALGLAAYYWAVQIRTGPRKLAFWLTGLFSGLAIVAKISYLLVMVPSIAILIVWGLWSDFKNQDGWKTSLRAFLLGCSKILFGVVIAVLPHLIKNGLWFHNPIAPFGTNTTGWTNQIWYGRDITQRILLTYPLALTFGSYYAQLGNLSPLILAFLPLALLLPRPRSLITSPLAVTTLAGATGTLAWIAARPSLLAPRYILATLLLLTLLPIKAAEYVGRSKASFPWLAIGIKSCIGLTLIATWLYFLNVVFIPLNTRLILTGRLNTCGRENEYLHCQAMRLINQDAKQGDRVFLASFQRYWLRPDLLQCLNTEGISGDTPESRWLMLYQQGFHYLLIDKETHSTIVNLLDLSSPPPWLKLTKLFYDKKIEVYRLDVPDPPAPLLVKCQLRPRTKIWELVTP